MSLWPATNLNLECYPSVPEHVARAWNAADDYTCHQLQTLDDAQPATNLLINDRHGALGTLLPSAQSWLDSHCSLSARQHNWQLNQCVGDAAQAVIWHEQDIASDIERVIIQCPKSFEQLKFWLHCCQQQLPAGCEYWLVGMAKHIPVNWLQWLEANVSHYQQWPIRKKARLMTFQAPKVQTPTANSGDQPINCWLKGYQHQGLELQALPGVFCRQQLDIGSRMLLPTLLSLPIEGQVCDLGCGNGLLGLSVKAHFPDAQLSLTDDSFVATRAATHNAQLNKLDVEVFHGHALSALNQDFDWVICNPPYHDGHKELTNIAEAMFRQAKQQLVPSGKLVIVANRHLPYAKTLQRLFKQVEVVQQDAKFRIYLASQT